MFWCCDCIYLEMNRRSKSLTNLLTVASASSPHAYENNQIELRAAYPYATAGSVRAAAHQLGIQLFQLLHETAPGEPGQ